MTIKVRYADFETRTRSRTLSRPVWAAHEIYAVAERLLREHTDAGERPIRLIGVQVGNLVGREAYPQLGFDFS